MRSITAKRLKNEVMYAMYLDKETSKEELKKNRKDVFASSDFKPVYRAKKKNYNKTVQYVNVDYTQPKQLVTVEKHLEIQKQRRHKIKMR